MPYVRLPRNWGKRRGKPRKKRKHLSKPLKARKPKHWRLRTYREEPNLPPGTELGFYDKGGFTHETYRSGDSDPLSWPKLERVTWDWTGFNPMKDANPWQSAESRYNFQPVSVHHEWRENGFPCQFDVKVGPGLTLAGALKQFLGSASIEEYSDPYGKAWDSAAPVTSGASAWQKFAPLKPKGNMTEFIGNLGKVPEMLMGDVAKYASSWLNHTKDIANPIWDNGKSYLAKSWLEYNFGYLPTYHDVKKLFVVGDTAQQAYDRFVEKNGKWERRGGRLRQLEYHNTEHSEGQNWIFGLWRTHDTLEYSSSVEEWFSGHYRYYIPEHSFKASPVCRALRHAGILSPRGLYNLVPWSWLADWFYDYGAVVSNLESMNLDNLVAKNACIMRRFEKKVIIRSTLVFSDGHEQEVAWSGSSIVKSRTLASPFGLTTGSDFTPKQLSLLGALGLDRLANTVGRLFK